MKTESLNCQDGGYRIRLGASSKLLSLEVDKVPKRVGTSKKREILGKSSVLSIIQDLRTFYRFGNNEGYQLGLKTLDGRLVRRKAGRRERVVLTSR